ncbi:MAG: class I SAM-dependent methyltransferase [Methylovulum sp.]|uniref:class I SAM-dependent methyltransferase n=1 Tax=Methylovulum sp. TaxID=1916980 RepID=UPI0026286AB3|nr:class I SAM-dependent methyltransferase [Methylovulum sp.]MDD2723714.1 class I SAM-dependent methyltransferase [Methylovulum sp.]MDD5123312.1 class I SAM-dependent methyltransferase [Methylovulum sp.]
MSPQNPYLGKLAVLYEDYGDIAPFQQLADQLAVPLRNSVEANFDQHEAFFLCWRDGCLKLLDKELLKKGGMMVEIEPREGEQRSWPAPKDGALAKALGRKTKTVVDATTGWGQDSLHIFRMGYGLLCLERSPVMAALLADGLQRLAQEEWMQRLQLHPPRLLAGNAIDLLATLPEPPDCIYLDPMFPPKRKKSALAKKSMMVLRDLLGDDEDKDALFAAAMQATGKRVVVKCPDYAQPLGGGKPSDSFHGKLLRYDVFLKN